MFRAGQEGNCEEAFKVRYYIALGLVEREKI